MTCGILVLENSMLRTRRMEGKGWRRKGRKIYFDRKRETDSIYRAVRKKWSNYIAVVLERRLLDSASVLKKKRVKRRTIVALFEKFQHFP